MKVARIVQDLAKRNGVNLGRLIAGGTHAAGHELRGAAGRLTGRIGRSHIQFDHVHRRHIFYGVMGLLLAASSTSLTEASELDDYEFDVTATYTNPYPGRSVFNAWTFSYWCGDDSWLGWTLDFLNPLEVVAMGADAGRWLDRAMSKELLGVTLSVSKRGGPPIISYSFDPEGNLVSVAEWKDASVRDRFSGEQYLEWLESGVRDDPLLKSLGD